MPLVLQSPGDQDARPAVGTSLGHLPRGLVETESHVQVAEGSI